ncbi:MAG: glycosyltransferase family 39 protein [Chloroflexi bacterium]|nr:glycosyltransferase family 39 protein [Chloroflexota bacterium]
MSDESRGFYNTNKFLHTLEVCILLAIVFLGFGLRYYKVGKDSFWLDEAGQALAAIQPRIMDTLMIVRQHAGAMPLDYLVTRLMAMISLDEKVMRFPSVVWGTLSIVIYFCLVRELDFPDKKSASFLVALLLSLSPVYIQYSQEMRFYASLVFFYAASTLLLIRAIKEPSVRNWLFYVSVTLIGEYFHPYVLFTVITGFVLILVIYTSYKNSVFQFSIKKGDFSKFLVSSIVLIACYVPGYLFFNSGQTFSYDLGFHSDVILEGLGLQAIRLDAGLGSFGVWHIILMIGMIGGLFIVIKQYKEYQLVLSLLVAFFLQFALIVGLDTYKHYFFSARQIIHLAPLLLLLVSIFMVECIVLIKPTVTRYVSMIAILAVICASPLPYIKAVYDYSKGTGGAIAQTIISKYQPGQEVLIFSSSYKIILDYYFLRFEKPDHSLPVIVTVDTINELRDKVNANPDIAYVVAPRNTTGDVRAQIVSLGFKTVSSESGGDFLFVRSQ